MARRTKWIVWVAVLVVAVAIGATAWVRRFRSYTPAAALQDLQAAAQARGTERPVERFLEIRYGPLTNPDNRQQVLMSFFDVDHIEGLSLIAGHLPAAEKQARVLELAGWIADYRGAMTASEKEALNAYFRSETGQARIRQATAHYRKKDSRLRAESAPVIEELMTTLAAIQSQ